MKNTLIFDFDNTAKIAVRYMLNKFERENNVCDYTFMYADKENFNNGNINALHLENNSDNNVISVIEKIYKISQVLNNCGSYELIVKTVEELKDNIENYKNFLNRDHRVLMEKTNKIFNELKNVDNDENLDEILQQFNNAISDYKTSIRNKKDQNINEIYFNKFIDKIKNNYIENLFVNDKISPIRIIRLCIDNDMFIQTIIFFTEWMPKFLTENYIAVNDENVIKECEDNAFMWPHWSTALFRNYQVKISQNKTPNISQPESCENLHRELSEAFKTGTFENVVKILNNRDEKFEKIIRYMQEFCEKNTLEDAKNKILSLDEDDPIKILIQAANTSKKDLDAFIAARLKKEKNTERFLVKAFFNLPKVKNCYFYTTKSKNEETEQSTNVIKKPKTRRDVFEFMLNNKTIVSSINKDNLLDFVEIYDSIAKDRNNIAHAITDEDTVKNQADIINKIKHSLDLIDKKAETICLSEK